MNSEMTVWTIALCLGLIFMMIGVIYWLVIMKKNQTKYAIAVGFEFLSTIVMYIPNEIYNNLSDNDNMFLRIVEGVLTSIIRSVNIYAGSEYGRIAGDGFSPEFFSVYGIVRVLANIFLVLFVGGFIFSFFEGPYQIIRLSLCRSKKIYIFSECNEKTLLIAESIIRQNKRAKIVFAGITSDKTELYIQRIKDFDGIFVEYELIQVIKKLRKHSKPQEIFLFNDKEEKNIASIENVCSVLANNPGKTRLYVELSDVSWSNFEGTAAKYNPDDSDKLVINFVKTDENFAYNFLLKNSIFDNAIGDNVKSIKLLIVGSMKQRNLELLKAVLHLGQMPGYKLSILNLSETEDKAYIHRIMPEVYDKCDCIGDALYSLNIVENIDFKKEAFEKIISNEFNDFTFAFINAGSDLINLDLLARLNCLCKKSDRTGYKIYVNLEDENCTTALNQELFQNVRCVGAMKDTYSYKFITMSDIELATRKIHEVRYGNKKSWSSYCNNEHNRHSVYARTLSFAYKVELIDELYSEIQQDKRYDITSENRPESYEWKVYEHMRWNMYTRTLGYSLCSKEFLNKYGKPDMETGELKLSQSIRKQSLVHEDLVEFKDLSQAIQSLDGLRITPEIAKILKNARS